MPLSYLLMDTERNFPEKLTDSQNLEHCRQRSSVGGLKVFTNYNTYKIFCKII